ncbi:hypothetical protein EVAR_63629_1 [Eumeta japonica]|uniref:Uncharacterized protein n=1 Tax=Eumeta variegata TaxID=151549 RepID=A0A4C1ZVD0_EUMVA|nr:hypothetical protein EVAR_63629_1 [Eumeta japonica]
MFTGTGSQKKLLGEIAMAMARGEGGARVRVINLNKSKLSQERLQLSEVGSRRRATPGSPNCDLKAGVSLVTATNL